jgi:polar amino acid transport system substrate-binding protein
VTAATTSLLYAASQTDGLESSPWSTDNVPQCIGFPNDSELAPAFQAAINELIADGTYDTIMEKWGVADLGTIDQAELLQ